MKSAWKILSDHPPCLVRLLARRRLAGKQVRALSSQEIAIVSGLSLDRVTEIQQMRDWSKVTVHEAERFVLACNFDPLNSADRNRKEAYQRSCSKTHRPHFTYLKKSPLWRTEFVPLIKLFRAS